MPTVQIERLGGIAGFGGPGSHLRSHGSVDSSKLTAPDRATVESLFSNPPPASDATPDAFVYRLTRQTPKGPQTIDVQEHHVPEAVRAKIQDELI